MFKLKFPRGKKAIGMDFIVGIIIVLISFAVIAPIASKYVGEDEGKAESLCKSSVATRASTSISIGDDQEVRTVPVLCKTIDKRIKGDKKEVMKQIADKMVKCWEMFGTGLYDKNIFENLVIMGGKKSCFMCYTMTIDEIENNEKITPKEFEKFLREEYHPKIKGQKYLEYIQSYGGKGQVVGLLPKEGIVSNSVYAIAYKAKQAECKNCGYMTLGGAATAGAGVLMVAYGPKLTGLSLVAAGGYTALKGGETILNEMFSSEIEIDAIYLVDYTSKELKELFIKSCNEIEKDIGGE